MTSSALATASAPATVSGSSVPEALRCPPVGDRFSEAVSDLLGHDQCFADVPRPGFLSPAWPYDSPQTSSIARSVEDNIADLDRLHERRNPVQQVTPAVRAE